MPRSMLKEFNSIIKDLRSVSIQVGYCYPSTYRAGMTSLATHLFYSILNSREDTSCERYFRFDTSSPVHSVETARELGSNHIVAFSLSWEEDILHLIQMLEQGRIEPLSRERREESPIVLVGGPVVSANPEPYTDFVDAFVIGEGDIVINDIIDAVKTSSSRAESLEKLTTIPGVYIPSAQPERVSRLIMPNLDDLFHPTTQVLPDVPEGSKLEPVFGKSLLVEVTRGCGHSCRFCLVGHICRPRRTRSLERLQSIIDSGLSETPVRKVSLIGSSLGDMDRLEELSDWIVKQGFGFSAPSLRADSVTKDLLKSLVEGGQRTLTIAPEAGSSDLRRAIGKGIDDAQIENVIDLAAKTGYRSIKLYFIIGLPGETDDDVDAIVRMVKNLASKSGLRITASVNPFVPKAHTRWQRQAQVELEALREKLNTIEKGLRNIPRTELEGYDPRSARIQAVLSIGDRSIGPVILQASRYGGLGGWRRAERESGVPFFSIANDSERLQGSLPWSFLDS